MPPLIPPVPADRTSAAVRLAQELLSFPARYLAELPVKVRIRVQASGLHREIEITTGRVEPRPGALQLNGSELRALALGAEAERLFPSDVKGYCLLKLHDPAFEITEELALGGVEPVAGPGWPLFRVLAALELELRGAEVEEPQAAAALDRARAA
jgi:hypothetical protein